MAASTPVKKAKCLACLDVNPWRVYTVGGRKWKSDGMNSKIQVLYGSDSILDYLNSSCIGVCHACLLRINTSYVVVTSLRDNITRLRQCKREAKTPGDGAASPKRGGKGRKRKPKKLFDVPLTSSPTDGRSLGISELTLDISAISAVPSESVSETTAVSTISATLSPSPSMSSARKPPSSDINGDPALDKENIPPVSQQGSINLGISRHHYSSNLHSYSRQTPSHQPNNIMFRMQNLGLQWNDSYYNLPPMTAQQMTFLHSAITTGNTETIVFAIINTIPLYMGLKRKVLEEIQAAVVSLSSLKQPSVLRTKRPISELTECRLPELCIEEMETRCGFLLDVLLTVLTPQFEKPSQSFLGPLSLLYGMLMFNRNCQLSAMQRTMTLAMSKGSITEQCLMTCNKLGITLSPTSKTNLLDECCADIDKEIKKQMTTCCLCNLVGDNCDIRIAPNHQALDHQVRDCHYFATLLVFSRMADQIREMSTVPPRIDPDDFDVEQLLLSQQDRQILLQSYKVLLGRLLVKNVPAFGWMASVLPKHIPHMHSDAMSRQSHILPLRLSLKNEAKYEDCVQILDETEATLHGHQQNANDGQVLPEERRLPFYGDQLTRVRLQGAKMLRRMAPNPAARFDDIGPFMCTLWHNKQDFLHKIYRRFWFRESGRDPGTLFYFKVLLRHTNVNGNVKSNFKAHEELLLLVGEFYLMEQVLEYCKLDSYDSWPECVPRNVAQLSAEEKRHIADQVLLGVLEHYQYAKFSLNQHMECVLNPPADQVLVEQRVIGQTEDGRLVIIHTENPAEPDHIMRHASNLSMWTMHMMHLNDLAKEGDFDRAVLGSKLSIPFFFSHSKLSKYYVENIDFLLKTEHISSPQMKVRLLEGSFVNEKGGKGHNVETDLAMEHSIRNKKDLIRSLGANKTEAAIIRVTMAADVVATITKNFNNIIGVAEKGGRHTKRVSDVDRNRVRNILRNVRPFRFVSGRRYQGMPLISGSPFAGINLQDMRASMKRAVTRLCRGQVVPVEEEEDEN